MIDSLFYRFRESPHGLKYIALALVLIAVMLILYATYGRTH